MAHPQNSSRGSFAKDGLTLAGTAFTASAAEINRLDITAAGTVQASKALVVGASREIATLGNVTSDGVIATTYTNASATPSTVRTIYGKYVTGVSASGSGNAVGVRGEVTITSSTNFGGGAAAYAYGVQGKLIADSATIAATSGHVCAVLAQVSGSSLTATSGHIAGLIVSGQNLPTSANINAIYVESGGGTINSILQANCKATYAFSINNFESSGVVSTPAGSTHGGNLRALKVELDGAAYYILAAATLS